MSDPLILAIETSVENGSVAILKGEKVILERSFFAGRKPSATLWAPLKEVMEEISSLSAIVVGIGPGSYNGSRVGIAAAQGIALNFGCPVIPLCSFEGVTSNSSRTLAIGDARRGHFSLQQLSEGRLLGSFSLVDNEKLAEALRASAGNKEEVFSFDESNRFPVATDLQQLIHRKTSSARTLAAAYLKRSESEREKLSQTVAEPFYLRDPHITVGKRKSLLER